MPRALQRLSGKELCLECREVLQGDASCPVHGAGAMMPLGGEGAVQRFREQLADRTLSRMGQAIPEATRIGGIFTAAAVIAGIALVLATGFVPLGYLAAGAVFSVGMWVALPYSWAPVGRPVPRFEPPDATAPRGRVVISTDRDDLLAPATGRKCIAYCVTVSSGGALGGPRILGESQLLSLEVRLDDGRVVRLGADDAVEIEAGMLAVSPSEADSYIRSLGLRPVRGLRRVFFALVHEQRLVDGARVCVVGKLRPMQPDGADAGFRDNAAPTLRPDGRVTLHVVAG